jgi:septal ring factor EnvC (AmiA/AmiB activator)
LLQIQNRLSESTNNERDLKLEIKKQEDKLNECKKKLTKYEEEFELKEKQIQNFNIEKTNLQKALTSAYRELAEVKQGN